MKFYPSDRPEHIMETKEALYDQLSEAWCLIDDMKQQRVRLEEEINKLHLEVEALRDWQTGSLQGLPPLR